MSTHKLPLIKPGHIHLRKGLRKAYKWNGISASKQAVAVLTKICFPFTSVLLCFKTSS